MRGEGVRGRCMVIAAVHIVRFRVAPCDEETAWNCASVSRQQLAQYSFSGV